MELANREERLDTQQRIELAEGVNIRLRVAGLPVRFLAYIIDYLICAGIILGAVFVLSIIGVATESFSMVGILLLLWFIIRWFYNVPFELGKRGATPGKRAMKIRVMQTTGTPVTVGQSLLRNLLRFVDEMPSFLATLPLVPTYLFGSIAIVCGRRFQRLGDLAAGTIVIYDDEKFAVTPSYYAPAAPQAPPFPAYGSYLPPHPQPPPIPPQPTPPRFPLHREEQVAFTSFRERLPLWSAERRMEIADHLAPLTGKTGPAAVNEVVNIGAWLDEAR